MARHGAVGAVVGAPATLGAASNSVFGERAGGAPQVQRPQHHPLLFYTPDMDPPRYNFPVTFRWLFLVERVAVLFWLLCLNCG